MAAAAATARCHTERLYYIDSDSARVFCLRGSIAPPTATQSILDRTASSHLTLGRQPFDLGAIGDAAVIEVIDETIGWRIAWGRRRRNKVAWRHRLGPSLRRHTGQYLRTTSAVRR